LEALALYLQPMKIQQLPSDVIDQIAAGEVVERPAHMVKELIENSLDAGATLVEVEFDQGGRHVRVTDNGSGIMRDELALALSRHATSKIAVADDLFALHSYGFRGEALASIAGVAQVTLTSRTSEMKQAGRLRAEFGQVRPIEDVGGNPGTTILIEELFANIPARLKFLKSDVAESTQIKNVLKALALIHYKVEFRVRSQGKTLQVWARADSPLARAEQVLGIRPLYENESSVGDFKAHVIFASPHDVAQTSRQIWIFAQDRWVQDRSLQAAVMDAYRGLLMHGEYPIAVVNLQAKPAEIDVNIHPTKSQVKFRDAPNAFRAVHRCVREGLEKAPWIPNASFETASLQAASSTRVSEAVQAYSANNLSFEQPSFSQTQFQRKMDVQSQFVRKANQALDGSDEFAAEFTSSMAVSPSAQRGYWSSLQVLGQANLTYIVSQLAGQSAGKLVFVDQHAAHERVAYERLMQAWQTGAVEVQSFLLPLTLNLDAEAAEALIKLAPDLQKLGIQLDALGPEAVAIRSAPAQIKDAALTQALQNLAREMVEKSGSFALEKKIGDLCATLACHSVVRAGQALSHQQMVSLLEQMDEFPLSSFCPHGRPVSVDYPFPKLERDFGRTV
jgi:DNA mismatch repair protein MutL